MRVIKQAVWAAKWKSGRKVSIETRKTWQSQMAAFNRDIVAGRGLYLRLMREPGVAR